MSSILPRLWLSPVSQEVMEAIWALAGQTRGGIGVMCSCGQVGPGAYTGLTRETFGMGRALLSRRYGVNPPVERDHLMKGGEDPQEWLDADCAAGFNGAMLHTHRTDVALDVIERYRGRLWFEVGPGEDDSRPIDADMWSRCAPHAAWFSLPLGTRIEGLGNRGEFEGTVAEEMFKTHGVPIRAHNCDYLDPVALATVSRSCHGLNIAPQLGVVQSMWYLYHGVGLGYPVREWVDACLADEKNAARWSREPWQGVIAVGHYHYDLLEWRDDVYEEFVEFMTGHLLRVWSNIA